MPILPADHPKKLGNDQLVIEFLPLREFLQHNSTPEIAAKHGVPTWLLTAAEVRWKALSREWNRRLKDDADYREICTLCARPKPQANTYFF